MTYEETPVKKTKKINIKQIQKGNDDMNKEALKKATAEHRAHISKLRADIKKHKLLIKQARITYKLTKVK